MGAWHAGSAEAAFAACTSIRRLVWLAGGPTLRRRAGLQLHVCQLRLPALPLHLCASVSAARAEARAAVLTMLVPASAPAGSKDPKSLVGLVKALNLSQVWGEGQELGCGLGIVQSLRLVQT